jgi:hypothetical protein
MRLQIVTCAAMSALLAACGQPDAADATADVAITDVAPAEATPQDLADVALTEMNAIAAAIAGVTDQAGAEAAARAIAESGVRMQTTADAAGVDPNDPSVVAIFLPRQQEFMETQMRLAHAIAVLEARDPALLTTINEALVGLPGATE